MGSYFCASPKGKKLHDLINEGTKALAESEQLLVTTTGDQHSKKLDHHHRIDDNLGHAIDWEQPELQTDDRTDNPEH